MNPTKLVLDIIDLFIKTYSIILKKPYVAVRVTYTPQTDRTGKVTKELIAFTIINESGPEVDIQRAWFSTSFRRQIFSEFINAKLPVKVRRKDRATYIVPMEDLKAALNKRGGDTIVEAAVLDKTGRRYAGRVDKTAQEEFSK